MTPLPVDVIVGPLMLGLFLLLCGIAYLRIKK